ncbi:COBRA-like protein 6 [Cannabis sativa]|uniref:COBRA-like protein 6 n=1 Tax=Cannabis sativa TaxID=3483 RepID=UPI0011E01C84|nr:COBRA-like protein 6 [Cannabis sativa]
MGVAVILIFILFSLISSPSYGYDPLDPYGNVSITWDFILQNGNTYDITVSIRNNQLYRHVESPGWRVGWEWKGDEVIWNMWGAEAREQGNCAKLRGEEQLPHCCEKKPEIVDLMPGTPYNLQVSNCCRGGFLGSLIQDPTNHLSTFRMIVGDTSTNNNGTINMPQNFTLGLPGYTCGNPFQVSPTRFSQDGGRRYTQALETWKLNCMYSQFRASTVPNCCVSLSAFYNDTIVPCPKCSCNCQGLPGAKCLTPENEILQLPVEYSSRETKEDKRSSLVRCSEHMCPIRVHWHVKQSYREYWRVKITITNMNFAKNYSHWNLLVLHPNLQSLTQVFSFNYRSLNQYGNINDSGIFWGIEYYNDMLVKSGKSGNVQSEMLLHKDTPIFSFKQGWAFPRMISFNGDHCVMPSPDHYPTLPNIAQTSFITPKPSSLFSLFLFSISILIKFI